MATSTGHRWRFTRSGGSDQPRLETAEDFANLEHLDLKLWAALACPVKGLEFDERTLALIDTDNDGRVRAPEIIAAVQWCEDHLRDLAALKEGTDALPLSQINDQTPSGKAILASAKQILRDLGKPDATAITLADAADTAKIFAGTRFNGDGIVPADAAEDDATRRAIADVIACMGAVADRSGKPGVDQAKLDAFFAQCAAFDAWATAAESDPRCARSATPPRPRSRRCRRCARRSTTTSRAAAWRPSIRAPSPRSTARRRTTSPSPRRTSPSPRRKWRASRSPRSRPAARSRWSRA